MNKRWRHFIKRMHPQGIPWPGSTLYNALSNTAIFLKHYELVAHDVARYGAAKCILDIGTGPGQLLLAMRNMVPDNRIIGIDISPAMVAQAHRNIDIYGRNHKIEVHVADASALPFVDETFDRVVSTGSLHHWKDPIGALSEVYRVLKPDSYALLYDLVRDIPKAIGEDVRARFGSYRFALLWLHSYEEPFLNSEEMVELASRTDFTVEGTKFVGALCCLVLKKVGVSSKNQGWETNQ
jgi:ubiquinone/menaquinone biosynthesis C-methylase UbiE